MAYTYCGEDMLGGVGLCVRCASDGRALSDRETGANCTATTHLSRGNRRGRVDETLLEAVHLGASRGR
jgi:hypothetical protein